MPELPEVETVRRGLDPVMTGVEIVKADVRRPDLRWPFPKDMAARLEGQTVTVLRRRSKYLLADLSGGETLLIHLGMSGRILISHDNSDPSQPLGQYVHAHAAPQKHDHVVLDLGNGARITFNDPRRFGAMDLMASDAQDRHKLLAKLGPEPLSNAFHTDHLAKAFHGRTTSAKAALLDQRIVAGLGNIYVCEALFRAGVSPKRAAGRIGRARLDALVAAIRDVLREAIEAGGSSLRDYRQTDGDLGYFQHAFRVYGREGETCVTPDCGTAISRIVQSGRSSFYCGRCQR